MASTLDILRKLFSRNVVITRLPGGRLKTFDVNKSQSIGSPTTYGTRAKWRSGRYINSVSGYGSGFTNEEFEAIRKQMYIDYELMDTDSIVSSANDIYADEASTQNEMGELLVIKTDDVRIKKILHNLFYDVLNIEFNLWSWIRTMCKYGDNFLYIQIAEKHGIVNVMPIHPSLIVREEGNIDDPNQTRFRYEGDLGFSYVSRTYFENYEIAHFRLLGDTNFLPYGKSILEGGRKEFKRMLLAEDSMLISRIMRAPERRLFKIDIGNIAPHEVEAHMEQVITETKKTPYIDPATGDYDLKYNVQASLEDVYMPVRGAETGTTIETLPGLQNDGMKEDVEYFKNKLIAALKVPKEYLGYSEEGGTDKCLHPDTKIPLLDGRVLTIAEISQIFKIEPNSNLWVYSFDFETNSVIPGKIKLAARTRKNAEIVRVFLDNDTHVDCTPDHNFLLQNGEQIEAQNLKPFDSLRAIYRRKEKIRKNNEYEQVFQPNKNKWVWTHKIVDEYINGKIIDNGYIDGVFHQSNLIVCHHADFNRFNNNPDNLQRMNSLDHIKLHSENLVMGLHSKKAREKLRETMQTKEYKEKLSNALKKHFDDNPNKKNRLRDNWLSLTHEQRSEIVKSGITPERLQLMSEIAKKVNMGVKGRLAIKLKYPNGRTDLQGANHSRWITRPDFIELLTFIDNFQGDKTTLNKYEYFCDAIGIQKHVVRDVIKQNGFTVNEFMNEYFGFREGRPKDLRLDYINELASNHETVESLISFIGISKKSFIRKIKKKYDFDQWKCDILGKCYNHKVVRIEYLTEKVDTFNLEVDDKNHNFLIENGIVIKNSGIAQKDLRFARTIERIQKIFISEFYQIAIIHLKVQGFADEDMLNFELSLTSPSLIYERQRVDIMTAKVDLAKSIQENNLFSDKYLYETIFGMTDTEWKADLEEQVESAKHRFRIKQIVEEGNDPEKTGKSFGTPWDIATLQVSSKFLPGQYGEQDKSLYTPDAREENPGKPNQYKGSFETKRDQDFGRDPLGRRELEKQPNMEGRESIKRFIDRLDKKIKPNVVKKTEPEMLNENNILDELE